MAVIHVMGWVGGRAGTPTSVNASNNGYADPSESLGLDVTPVSPPGLIFRPEPSSFAVPDKVESSHPESAARMKKKSPDARPTNAEKTRIHR